MTSRAGKSRSSGRPRRAAAVHRQGDAWCVAVMELSGRNGAVLDAQTLSAEDTAALKAVLDKARCETVVHIIPGAASVCRLVEVPDGPQNDLAAALSLLAEAELPESIPANRRGAGVVPVPSSDGHRAALLVGWLGSSEETPLEGIDQRWTSEVVALSSIAADSQSAAVMFADRAAGSISLFASNQVRSGVRTLREQGSSSDWAQTVCGAMDEMCRRVGHISEQNISELDASKSISLFVDPDSRRRLLERLSHSVDDAVWLQKYAICCGAAMAFLKSDLASDGLFSLQPAAQNEQSPLLERLAVRLSSRRVAVTLLTVGLLLALAAPLVAAAARRAILASKVAAIEEMAVQTESRDELDKRLAMFSALERERWPMSKLIAEVGRALPTDCTLSAINFDHGDRFTIRGEARSVESVNTFATRLSESGVFTAIERKRVQADRESSKDSYEFDVSGEVARPNIAAKGLDDLDYVEYDIVERLYGDAPIASDEESDEIEDGGEAESSTSRSSRRRRARDLFNSVNNPAEAAAPPPPDPISEEQINQLDRNGVMAEWTARLKASAQPNIDPEVKQRLKDEVDILRQRLQALRDGG